MPPVIELSRAEARAFFDQHARTLVGMTGNEFLRRLDAGEFDAQFDTPEHPAILELVMMRSFAQ